MSSIMYKTRTTDGWVPITDPTVPEWAKQQQITDLQVESITVSGVPLEEVIQNCAEEVILGGEW